MCVSNENINFSGYPMKKIGLISAFALCSAMLAGTTHAAPLSGTYTTGGATAGTGPWVLTSTNSTYSVLRLVLGTPITFGNLSSVVVDYTANLGGIGQGTPRLVVVTDADHDGIEDGDFAIHFGPAGSFADATLGAGSTGNLLSLTDWGRYDLGDLGGSAYTDRAAALGLAGGYDVLRLSLIVDSYGGNDRSFTINGFAAEGTAAVPEAATWAMMIAGFGLAGAAMRRRKMSTAISFA